ncbi:MAG: MFS transporter [Bacillaceae bacterium]|nr:MFS transporter [Bacillaceae bacterium]
MKRMLQILKNIPGIILVLLVINLTISTARFMTYPFLAVYFKQTFDLTAVEVGFLIGLSPLSSMLFSVIGGRLSDVYGVKRMYSLAVLTAGVSLAFYGMADSYMILCVVSIILGMSWSVYNVSNQTLLAVNASEKNSSRVFSYNYWVFNLGGVVGPFLGVRFMNSGHSPLVLFLFAGLMLFIGVSISLYFSKRNQKEEMNDPKSGDQQSTSERLFSKEVLKVMGTDKALYLMTIAYFSIFFIEAQLDTNIVQYLESHVENGVLLFGNMLSLGMALVIVLQPVVAHFLDKASTGKVIITGSTLYALGPFFFMLSDTHIYWYTGMILMTLGEIIFSPRLQSLITLLPRKGYKSTYFSIVNMGGNFAFFLGPVLGGYIYDYLGITLLFMVLIIAAILFGTAVMLSHFYQNKYHKNSNSTVST